MVNGNAAGGNTPNHSQQYPHPVISQPDQHGMRRVAVTILDHNGNNQKVILTGMVQGERFLIHSVQMPGQPLPISVLPKDREKFALPVSQRGNDLVLNMEARPNPLTTVFGRNGYVDTALEGRDRRQENPPGPGNAPAAVGQGLPAAAQAAVQQAQGNPALQGIANAAMPGGGGKPPQLPPLPFRIVGGLPGK